MRPTTNLLIKALVSAAMLTGLAAQSATTTETTQTTQTKTAPKQDFAGMLAMADLSKQGITDPTTAEVDAKVQSIQDQRASGMGWGEIANSLGLKLGAVVSAANRNKHADDSKHTKTADKRKGAEDSRSASSESHGGKASSSGGGGDHGGGKK